ncbi:hypothetical protein MACH18_13140 [Phaeobacter italicus]|nr:hypothetical protein MACH18_13140 [Phaeobacter italicus]
MPEAGGCVPHCGNAKAPQNRGTAGKDAPPITQTNAEANDFAASVLRDHLEPALAEIAAAEWAFGHPGRELQVPAACFLRHGAEDGRFLHKLKSFAATWAKPPQVRQSENHPVTRRNPRCFAIPHGIRLQ